MSGKKYVGDRELAPQRRSVITAGSAGMERWIGGSNISPVEVEQVLMSHPDVRDAAVVGVPDAELGERVAAFVQLASSTPESISLNHIRVHLATQLADYKIPESLRIVSEIPRSGLGKIDRGLLTSMIGGERTLI